MNGCLNILWHFPFLGFLHALLYAILGVILCCTIILYPVGLGFFQIAQFLLSPFSSALVSRKDLDLIQPSEQSTVAMAYSTLVSVLYIPFGILAAAGALFTMLGEFLSIIGIPCGIVWFKTLPAIFMPVNKVCVPKAVAEEIERVKAGNTVAAFKAGNTQESDPEFDPESDPESDPDRFEEGVSISGEKPEVRKFDTVQLQEIVTHAAMYRASLVEECRHELEIREKSSSFAEMVAAMDDAKIREILAHPQLYAEELIYACSQEHVERDRIRQEQQEREAEAARLERERKAEEERIAREQRKKEEAERRAVAWKKQRPYVFAVIAILVLAGIGVGGYSYYKEQNRLKQERIAAEQQRVAEELRAEQQRIAEEKAAEQRRIAAEKKREQQRIAAEQQRIAAEKAAEERRIAEEKAAEERRIAAENRIKNGIFEIGDIHPKLKGVVFWVSDSKKWGKVISLQETTSPQYKSFSWCKNLGANWRLPRLYELRQIYQSKDIINATLSQTGGDKLSEKTYWSEEDMGRNYIGTFDMKNGRNGQTFRKETAYQMRAVSVFQ